MTWLNRKKDSDMNERKGKVIILNRFYLSEQFQAYRKVEQKVQISHVPPSDLTGTVVKTKSSNNS
jgi:hypothetical protein